MKPKPEPVSYKKFEALREAHLSSELIDDVLIAGTCLGAIMGITLGLILSHFFGFWIWLWVLLAVVGGIAGLVGSATIIADEVY